MSSPPGQVFDLGGRRLHLWRRGTGSPAVVIATGGGVVALRWASLVDAISEFTTVVIYDRPGYGWSEPSGVARSLDNVSQELEALLQAAAIPPPYVLVGHSIGGPYVRQFARRNPDKIAGLVLVDSSHEDQVGRLPIPAKLLRRQKTMMSLASKPWLMRLLTPLLRRQSRQRLPVESGSLRGRLNDLVRQESSAATAAAAMAEVNAMEDFPTSFTTPLPPVPVIVLVAGEQDKRLAKAMTEEGAAQFRATWLELQQEMASMSPLGELRIIEDSGHMIPDERPDAVIDAVKTLVLRARAVMA